MLLGLAGRIGAGKNTIANHLVDKHGYTERAFADKLKDATATLLCIPRNDIDWFKTTGRVKIEWFPNAYEKGSTVHGSILTGREVLQRMGTEVGREIFGEDFWVNQIDISPGNCVVSDVRFPNEVVHIEKNGGTMIWVDRPHNLQGKSSEHISEKLVLKNPVTITNDGTIKELHKKVDRLIEFLSEDGA